MMLDFTLHTKQAEIFQALQDNAQFCVVPAGRRGGKSFLAACLLITKALALTDKHGNDLKLKEIWYVAPSFEQAKLIMWELLKSLAEPVTEKVLNQTCVLRLKNGRTIKLKGADNPDSLVGVGISFVVLDEFSLMKPQAWEISIQPTLADVNGQALFIGTPRGRNHFYDLYRDTKLGKLGNKWQAFKFCSLDNPFISSEYIKEKSQTMSRAAFKQEFEASFDSLGNGVLHAEGMKIATAMPVGDRYITMDCAGFGEVETATAKATKLDETAITRCTVDSQGNWYFKLDVGRWGIRKTAIKFLNNYRLFKPGRLGIEQGITRNAILPYIQEEARKYGLYFNIEELKHGNQKKKDRIVWALAGRLEHGRMHYVIENKYDREQYNKLMDCMAAYPSKLVHDDGPDALAYVDQLSQVVHGMDFNDWVDDDYEYLDEDAGY